MKAEPKWGRRGVLQLNWVFDEYFATPEVWASFFEPHGIECRPVMNTRGAAPFPALRSEPSATMVKTKEYFGSGASAHKRVLISQAVARALIDHKVRGVSLRPVAERI